MRAIRPLVLHTTLILLGAALFLAARESLDSTSSPTPTVESADSGGMRTTTESGSWGAVRSPSEIESTDTGTPIDPPERAPGIPSGNRFWYARPPEPSPPEDAIIPSAQVGSVPGRSSVSARGSFRYSIPLWVPRGRAGMEPSLSVGYDSHGSNGILGVGWHLEGASAITRGNKILSREGEIDTVNFDDQDAFFLDGEKLVRRPGKTAEFPEGFVPPLPVSAEYGTERESFRRVYALGNGLVSQWVVFERDGHVSWYGESPPSQMSALRYGTSTPVIFGWLVSRTEDRRGNGIRYTYQPDPLPNSAGRLLESITYTESSTAKYSGSAQRRVEFLWESRLDPIARWVNGVCISTSSRLQEIHVFAPNPTNVEKVRSYRFDYGTSFRTKRSLLVSVKAIDQFGVSLPATTFRYAGPDGEGRVQYESREFPIEPVHYQAHPHVMLTDLNGDGFDDVVYDVYQDDPDFQGHCFFEPTALRLRVSTGRAADSLSAQPDSLEYLFPGSDSLARSAFTSISSGMDHDANGAGGIFLAGNYANFGGRRIVSWDDSQKKLVHTGDWLDNCTSGSDCAYFHLDFDGDGLPDVATTSWYALPSVHLEWVIDQNATDSPHGPNYAGFVRPLAWLGKAVYDDRRSAHIVDLDGNGTHDIVDMGTDATYRVIGTKQGAMYHTPKSTTNLERAVFADVNGDGLKDIVYPIGPAAWVSTNPTIPPAPIGSGEPVVSINTGNGFLTPYACYPLEWPETTDGYPLIHHPAVEAEDFSFRVADFNGDGKDDIAVLHADWSVIEHARKWAVSPDTDAANPVLYQFSPIMIWLSDGQMFYNDFVPPVFEVMSHWAGVWMGTQVGDVDGDGKPDIVSVVADNPSYCEDCDSCVQGMKLRVFTQRDIEEEDSFYDLLISVTNGYRAGERVAYDAFAPNGVSDPDPVHTPGPRLAYPERSPLRGAPLVRRRVVDLPDSAIDDVTEYRYDGARFDTTGRGLIGFAKVRRSNTVTGRVIETEYDLERVESVDGVVVYPWASIPARTTTTISLYPFPGRRIEESYDYDIVWGLGSFRVDLRKHLVDEYDGQAHRRHTETSYLYDAYANPEVVVRTVSGGSTQTTLTYFENRTNEWLIGLPLRREIRSLTLAQEKTDRTTEYVHDASGLLKRVIVEPDGPIDPDIWLRTTFLRDAAGLVTTTSREDAHGEIRVESYVYDADGVYLEQTTNPVGHVTYSYFHPGVDELWALSDPNGVFSEWRFDGFGRAVRFSHASGTAIELEYKGQSGEHPLEIIRRLAGGGEERTSYDFFVREVSRERLLPDGKWAGTRREYDLRGRTYRISRAKLAGETTEHVTEYLWDNLGRIKRIAYPDGSDDRWNYPDFHTRSHEDPEGRVTRRIYSSDDLVERIERDIDGTTQVTRLVYGPFGVLERIASPANWANPAWPTVDQEFDVLGRRIAIHDPDAGTLVEHYNAFGELRFQEDAEANQRTFTHDKLGRALTKASEDGTDTLVWDAGPGAVGRLSESTSADGVKRSFLYDAASGLLVEQRWELSGDKFAITTDYDSLGRKLRTSYPRAPDGFRFSILRGYASSGHLETILDETTQTELWRVVERTPDERVRRELRGDILDTTWTREPFRGRLVGVDATHAVTQTPVLSLAYSFYADGRMETRTDSIAQATDTADYDDLGRLALWSRSHLLATEHTVYDYDLAGRLREIEEYDDLNQAPIATTTYNFPQPGQSQPDTVTSVGQHVFHYDLAGRQIERYDYTSSQGVLDREIAYNSHNLPRSGSVDGIAFSILYDAGGERFRKSDLIETTYAGGLYERHRSGAKETHIYHVFGETGEVAQVEYDVNGPAHETRLLLQDGLGSTAAITDEKGNVKQSLFYAPFGQRIDAAGDPLASSSPTGGSTAGFTGHEHDKDLGFINMNGRIYDPALGRFLTPDPFLTSARRGLGTDRYGYVSNDPFNIVDPTGYDGEPADIEVVSICDDENNCESKDSTSTGDSGNSDGPYYSDPWANQTHITRENLVPAGSGSLPEASYYESYSGGRCTVPADAGAGEGAIQPRPEAPGSTAVSIALNIFSTALDKVSERSTSAEGLIAFSRFAVVVGAAGNIYDLVGGLHKLNTSQNAVDTAEGLLDTVVPVAGLVQNTATLMALESMAATETLTLEVASMASTAAKVSVNLGGVLAAWTVGYTFIGGSLVYGLEHLDASTHEEDVPASGQFGPSVLPYQVDRFFSHLGSASPDPRPMIEPKY